MAFNPASNTQILNYGGGEFILTYTLTSGAFQSTNWYVVIAEPLQPYFNVEILEQSNTSVTMRVYTLQPNSTENIITCFFYLYRTNLSLNPTVNSQVGLYNFKIDYDKDNIVKPVWEDTYFTYNGDYLNYKIYDDNNVIYAGTTIVKPNETNINLNINRIVAPYLNSKLSIEDSWGYIDDYSKKFTIKEVTQSGNEYEIGKFRFYNNYNYGNINSDIPTVFLNNPIKYEKTTAGDIKIKVDKRQFFILTAFNTSSEEITLTTQYIDKYNSINQDYIGLDNSTMYFDIGRSYFDTAQFVRYFTNKDIKSMIFEGVDTCYNYCLYYLNSNGGWDSLLVEGNVKKSDNIKSSYYTTNVDNTTNEFGKTKYINVIDTYYTLHTDWFNDDEQERFANLIESTEVYLHNLNTDKILPVNITNNTFEYKTFTNNGKKKFYNTLEVEVAQQRIRR